MDIAMTLLGVASGGTATAAITWLLGRRRQSQLDLVEISSKYWTRIDELERRLVALSTEVAELRGENAVLKRQLGMEIVVP